VNVKGIEKHIGYKKREREQFKSFSAASDCGSDDYKNDRTPVPLNDKERAQEYGQKPDQIRESEGEFV
jgi:hypothetical protein